MQTLPVPRWQRWRQQASCAAARALVERRGTDDAGHVADERASRKCHTRRGVREDAALEHPLAGRHDARPAAKGVRALMRRVQAAKPVLRDRSGRRKDDTASIVVSKATTRHEQVQRAVHVAMVGDLDSDHIATPKRQLEALTAVGEGTVWAGNEPHPRLGLAVEKRSLVRAHDRARTMPIARALISSARCAHEPVGGPGVAHAAIGDARRVLALVP